MEEDCMRRATGEVKFKGRLGRLICRLYVSGVLDIAMGFQAML